MYVEQIHIAQRTASCQRSGGGGSPDAMKTEIFRNYPIGSKVDLVERLLERGVLADATRKITRNRQPGRCCVAGCQMSALPAEQAASLPKPASAAGRPDLLRDDNLAR